MDKEDYEDTSDMRKYRLIDKKNYNKGFHLNLNNIHQYND